MSPKRLCPRQLWLLAVLALAFTTVATRPLWADWLTRDVGGTSVSWPKVAVSADTIGVAYRTSGLNLVLATLTPGSTNWSTQTVVGTGHGASPSLAVDGNGNFCLAYCESDSTLLKLAYRSGGTWHYETIGAVSSPAPAVDLAYDSNGTPHVIYSYGTSTYYAYRSGAPGTSWTIESSIFQEVLLLTPPMFHTLSGQTATMISSTLPELAPTPGARQPSMPPHHISTVPTWYLIVTMMRM